MKNRVKLAVFDAVCAVSLLGCVSVENTAARLQSSDPAAIKQAEKDVAHIAEYGFPSPDYRKSLVADYDSSAARIEYVKLLKNTDVLIEIGSNSRVPKQVRDFAWNAIDLTNPKNVEKILLNGNDCDCEGGKKVYKAALDSAPEKLLIDILSNKLQCNAKFLPRDEKIVMEKQLIEKSSDVIMLSNALAGKIKGWRVEGQNLELVAQRLVCLADKIKDKKIITELLQARYDYRVILRDAETRLKLMSKLPEEDVVNIVSTDFGGFGWDDWNNDAFAPVDEIIGIMPQINNPKSKAKVANLIFKKINGFKAGCKKNYMMRWNEADDKKAASIVKRVPMLSDEDMKELFALDEESFLFVKDRVTESVAYAIISSGIAKNQDAECELAAKLSAQKCDLKVYNGAKFVATKKAIVKLMSDAMKKEVAKQAEKAFAVVCEKAKVADKETFSLEGLYLGMVYEDALIVLQHHFPKIETEECVDGEGENADYVVYVNGQTTPFCYASVGDKKVWQFNIGKQLLKKWYNYDVQTPVEWASAYSKETKADMRFKLIEKDATVHERDGSRSYRVYFRQESYQYKHNTKQYRLTYFGQEKDFTCEDGMGGALIKELAAPRFRYVRGDQGTLRAVIERD